MAPSLVGIGKRMIARRDRDASCAQGTGRMPAFPDMGGRNINDVVDFLVTGKDKGADPAVTSDPNWLKYRIDGYDDLPRSRRLPADHAAVGHAERDRSQCRHHPLEDSVRRVSRAGRQGADQHRQRQLRRPGRHRERAAVHRRHQLRQEVPRLRQADRQAAVGNGAARRRQRHAVDLPVQRPAVRRHRVRRRQERRAVRQQYRGVRPAALELSQRIERVRFGRYGVPASSPPRRRR